MNAARAATALLALWLTGSAPPGTPNPQTGYADCAPSKIDAPRLRRAILAAARPRGDTRRFFADNVVVVAPAPLRDGPPDMLAYVAGPSICGSGGCNAYLFEGGAPDRVLGRITPARLPIRVLDSIHEGRRDIGVTVNGGGVRQGYVGTLRFDGKAYAGNPTLAGVARAPADAGTAVIGLPGQAAGQCRLR